MKVLMNTPTTAVNPQIKKKGKEPEKIPKKKKGKTITKVPKNM